MTNKSSSGKGWTEAQDISLLLQLITKPPDWSNFVPPEGRTVKACQEHLMALRKKAGQAVKEGEIGGDGSAASSPKTPRRHGHKKKDDGGASGEKATGSKKRKITEDMEDDDEDDNEAESPSKRGKFKSAKVEDGGDED